MSYRLSNYKHVPHNVVEHQHIENLLKLRQHLLELPKDYRHFDMMSYTRVGGRSVSLLNFIGNYKPLSSHCGAVACAIGHTFAAGVALPSNISSDWTWETLAEELYGIVYDSKTHHAWMWCFDSMWTSVDNTPQGAGHRIGYMLQHNIPVDDGSHVVVSPAIYQPA